MDRDMSTPLSSLVLSTQVFRPTYPSRFGNERVSLCFGNSKDQMFIVPNSRNFMTSLSPMNIKLKPDHDIVQPDGMVSSSIKSKSSEHSVKINKIVKIPFNGGNFTDLGSHGLVSEGSFNTATIWPPVGNLNGGQTIAGKLLMPNFSNMKATCGQRGSLQNSYALPAKNSSSLGNSGEVSRSHQLTQSLLNSSHNGTNHTSLVTEIIETGHYDYLKSPASRAQMMSVAQREKYISVTYKEQVQIRGEKPPGIVPVHHFLPNDSTKTVAGEVEYRLRLTDPMGERGTNKLRKNSLLKVEESNENIRSQPGFGQKNLASQAEEGEEFVSRAATPDDDESVRDGDSQVWDDDGEVIDDEDDMTDAGDNDDDTADEEEAPVQRQGPQTLRGTSAAPSVPVREHSAGVSATKKPLSPLPLSRLRQAQQEQQQRLRDSIGVDKARPVTGCAVVYNGSSSQVNPGLRNKLASLAKRSVTRPPTAAATSTSQNFDRRSTVDVIPPFKRRVSRKVGGEEKTLLPLQPSLFSNVPPTLVFAGEEHTVGALPRDLRILLRWRTSTITPNVLKKILARSNFKLTAKDDVWVGCWAKHMKQDMFRALREFQKFNHFPASFQIGRKDRLWRNLCAMQARFGRKEFGFFPQTYILPGDYKLLKRIFEETNTRQRWILKPPASARGNGIRLVCSMKQVPKKRPVIVQKYIHQPYLINESKFDIRLYVYVASYDPLKAYIYTDGLARFASTKYSASLRDLPNKFMHLTNYSINKHNSEYQSNGDEDACEGHKWSLHALWSYLSSQPTEEDENGDGGAAPIRPVDIDQLWASIKDIALKTIISAEQHVVSAVKMNVVNRYAVHELFGFDILLDRELKPWLLEVNISPSLHSDSPLDIKVKGEMLKDLLNLAGYRLPDPTVVRSTAAAPTADSGEAPAATENICSLVTNVTQSTTTSSQGNQNKSHFDPRLVSSTLSVDERSKHSYFTQNWRNESVLRSVLDTLTPDDVRLLIEFEDERSRLGAFEPLFPTVKSRGYLRMMDPARYYNLLLDAWLRTYGEELDFDGNRNSRHEKGLELLDSLCRRGIHLENPTNDWRHIWKPPAGGTLAPIHRSGTSSANVLPSSTSTAPIPNGSPVRQSLGGLHSQSTGSLPNCSDN